MIGISLQGIKKFLLCNSYVAKTIYNKGNVILNILLADDSETMRGFLEVRLKYWGYHVQSVDDGKKAWDILLSNNRPQIALLDWVMPEIDGVTLCRKIRSDISKSYIYIILLTAKRHKKDMIEALNAGADDFISKPFDLDELQVRIRAGKRIVQLMDQLISQTEELKILATYDTLTGCLNRQEILETLSREMSRSGREFSSLGILMIDIDYFKKVNDTYGHLTGDIVLKELAHRMKNAIRLYDTIGRYGGEEFLVILPKCGKEETFIVANRMNQCVNEKPVITPSAEITVTISIGITCMIPDPWSLDKDAMIQLADTALYQAKNKGRNCVEYCGSED